MGLGISTASYGFYSKNNPSGFITNKDVVFTTGNQTISGIKSFADKARFNNDGGVQSTDVFGNQSGITLSTFEQPTDLTFRNNFFGGYVQDIISFRNENNTGIFGRSINYDVPTSFNRDSIIFYQTGQGYSTIFSKGPYLRLGYHNIISELPESRLGIGTLFPQEKVHISGGNLRIDENINVSGFYNFNINTTGQPSEGQMTWSPDYNTVQIGMDAGNVINPVGFKSFYRVKAQSTIRKGTVVMAAGAVGGSEYILAREAQNIGPSGELIMGVSAEQILANNFGDVVAFGPVKGVNTSTFISGNVLYYDPLSTGGFTNTLPQAPNAKVLVGLTLTQGNNGVVFVRVSAGSELGKTDSNVIFSNVQNNDIIRYSSSGYWYNTGVDFNLFATAGNLSTTGSTLNTKINDLSGYINSTGSNIVFTTGNQRINGIKTFEVVRFEEYNNNGINLIPSDDQASSETLTIADDTQDVIATFDADSISLRKPTSHNHRPIVSINNAPYIGVVLSGETFPENNNTKYNYFTTNITLSANYINLANSTSGITATLPSIASGRNYIVKNLNTGILTVTGSTTIDGNVNLKLYKNESAHLLGVSNIGFTGWISLNTNPGIS